MWHFTIAKSLDLRPGVRAIAPRESRQIIDGNGRSSIEDAVIAFKHFGAELRETRAAPLAPPGAAFTTGSVNAQLMLSSSTHASLYHMPMSHAAAEIDPVSRMLSSSLTLPGPMRAPDSKTRLILTRGMPALCHAPRSSRKQLPVSVHTPAFCATQKSRGTEFQIPPDPDCAINGSRTTASPYRH